MYERIENHEQKYNRMGNTRQFRKVELQDTACTNLHQETLDELDAATQTAGTIRVLEKELRV